MTTTVLPTHPILGAAEAIAGALDEVAEVEPVYMSAGDKEAALVRIARVESRLAELRLRIMATADDVAAEHGARDVSTWLAHQTRAEPRALRADLELARELDRTYRRVAAGMRSCAVSPAQARVITAALDALPDDLDPQIAASAEETLVGHCEQFRPSQLRRIGRRILDVVAPEIAEAEDAQRLDAEERRARQRASLRFRRLGDGTTKLTGLLPDAVADRLRTYLESFTSPRRSGGAGGAGGFEARRQGSSHLNHRDGDGVGVQDPGPFGQPQQRAYAHAFAALLEHLDPTRLPAHGGDATTVMVTISLDQLQQALATAGMLDADLTAGPNLTADQARRLACTAKIIPAVLGADSEILDLGRSQRLFSPAQRKAMRLRDKRCRAEGCTVPATWCEAHHLNTWATGGKTDLADGILLCNHHHHRAHDPTYTTDTLPDGDLRFRRRG